MCKKAIVFIFLFVFTVVKAQELNCSITVNSDQIAVSNNQIFKTLEKALSEFVNETKWTNIQFKQHERIKCSMVILLTQQKSTNSFFGSLQVQASRPVFNTSYYSPILNHQDEEFTFSYTEFQPLNYNPNNFESNLIATISHYVYFILGVYIDTFELEGGTDYFNKAFTIANQAQQFGGNAWQNKKNKINRFTLIDEMLSKNSEVYRKNIFEYHTNGMDIFESNQRKAVDVLAEKILSLKEIYNSNPNHFMIRMMMDAKADEIVNIFKENITPKTAEVVKVLKRVSTNNSKKWKKINAS